MSVVSLQNVWKSYGEKTVLSDISLSFDGVLCLMGPSGAGKTTLLRLLLELEAPDRGTVSRGLRWGAVFQEDRLLERRDALGNLRFALGRAYEEERARALLKELGLDSAEKSGTWSGGMKRRLALARALLAPSDALALDEPFTGLDEENRARALEALRRLSAGKPVILVTHQRADGEALGARFFTLSAREETDRP